MVENTKETPYNQVSSSLINGLASASPYSRGQLRMMAVQEGCRLTWEEHDLFTDLPDFFRWHMFKLNQLTVVDFFNPDRFQKNELVKQLQHYDLLDLENSWLYIDIRGKNLAFCGKLIVHTNSDGSNRYTSMDHCMSTGESTTYKIPRFFIPEIKIDQQTFDLTCYYSNTFFKHIVKPSLQEYYESAL